MKIFVINGPNLNLLGAREPEKYGTRTLNELIEYTQKKCHDLNLELTWWQSNSESKIINKIQSLISSEYEALIINPAAYSHTSVAILDALLCLKIPIAEVHISNVYRRESFRHQMLTAQASSIIMSGLGSDVYYHAALALSDK